MTTEGQKFIRLFDRSEIHLTACAVTKTIDTCFLLGLDKLDGYFVESNQFWKINQNHERALLKVYYKKSFKENAIICDDIQKLKIPMPFLGHDSSDGWGELQFLIKQPALVKFARNRSFDTRVNKWVEETKPIQPKTDFGTHAYLALRFYHQDYLPPVPSDWHFEPVYALVRSSRCYMFYGIDVIWEKEEIKVTVTALDKDSPEIPKHL